MKKKHMKSTEKSTSRPSRIAKSLKKNKKSNDKLKHAVINENASKISTKDKPISQAQPIEPINDKVEINHITPASQGNKKRGKHRYQRLYEKRKEKRLKLKQQTYLKSGDTKVENTPSLTSQNENVHVPVVADADANWKLLMKTIEKPKKRKFQKKDTVVENKDNDKKDTAGPEIWFDDVDEILLERPSQLQNEKQSNQENSVSESSTLNPLVKPESFRGTTKVVAMDCEMVGVGEGGKDSILARVSIVNQFGQCLYDKYVAPTETVTDYRTFVSGIKPEHLKDGERFSVVCKEVSDIIKGRILVGHAVHHDLKVLYLDHPYKQLRDTSTYKPFRQLFQGRTPSLKKLTEKCLGVAVQTGEHDSVEDARATVRLYTMHRQAWEKSIRDKRKSRQKPNKNKDKSSAST